jgi:ribosomal protein S3AE
MKWYVFLSKKCLAKFDLMESAETFARSYARIDGTDIAYFLIVDTKLNAYRLAVKGFWGVLQMTKSEKEKVNKIIEELTVRQERAFKDMVESKEANLGDESFNENYQAGKDFAFVKALHLVQGLLK